MAIEMQDLQLSGWAAAALVARCAKRYAEAYESDVAEPAAGRIAVVQAVALAEMRAELGGRREFSEPLEVDGQVFNSYDIDAISVALGGYITAARNTLEDLHEDIGVRPQLQRTLAAVRLALLALETAFLMDVTPEGHPQVSEAVDLAVTSDTGVLPLVEADLQRLRVACEQLGWTDVSGVPSDVFGPLWPAGRPAGWPQPRLTFRPRARIIRTIGDRLISGPEAAVIELVKNSYDADATAVRITLFPPLQNGQGEILFEDDGHGMTLEDIRDKWMEPATSDKRLRKESPRGRRLLGSKGIGRFAAARLGSHLELVSTATRPALDGVVPVEACERTRIPQLDWNTFEQTRYLDDVSFDVETAMIEGPTGTTLRVRGLRDEWTGTAVQRLHHELRRLVSPAVSDLQDTFRIVLDLSQCTVENSGFEGATIAGSSTHIAEEAPEESDPYVVRPFPVLDACDYAVDGVFDEVGNFDGTMTIRRAGLDPEPIKLSVPLQEGEDPCGIVLVTLNIFDREAPSIRSTAEKAGFGHLGVRDARKLLDSIAGVAIYREGFRVRPYGDAENDWLTLDAKRVQNPSLKIGRNQVAGTVSVDDEETSQLTERSSREGLEENGSFRRLQALILALLAREVEPRRRRFRISAGLDTRSQGGFREVLDKAELAWTERLLEKMPHGDQAEARKLVSRESEKLTGYLKDLEARQAKLEAQVTLGLIIGEVMHQGNTPLTFIENETARLQRWWPTLFDATPEAEEDRVDVPTILNGTRASASTLRLLFNALSPLAGARRGEPGTYAVGQVVRDTSFLFKSKAEAMDLSFGISLDLDKLMVTGYPEDLTTALTNLIDNAIYWLQHHRVAAPCIEIEADEPHARTVTIHVQDNGAGVPEDFCDQLFDVGFTQKTNGTGLGLSIAREAIFRSGGQLSLAPSVGGGGARFAITLPRAKT